MTKYIIIAVIVVIVLVIYKSIQKIKDSVAFDYRLASVDLSTLSITDLIQKQSLTIRVKLLFLITNKNNFDITIKNLKASFYDADTNTLIAKTSDTENNKRDIVITKGAISNIYQDVDFTFGLNSMEFFKNLKLKNPVNVRSVATFTIFNIPVTIDKTLVWQL